MTSSVLKFGTDGWRALIGEQYTFDNVARVALATASWLHDRVDGTPHVVLGFDTRFEGAAFARHAARVLRSADVDVTLSHAFTATPAISWATKAYGADAGVVLTASHNPPAWNGFKVKADFGGPALPAQIADIEGRIPEAPPASLPPVDDPGIRVHDVRSDYLAMLRGTIDLSSIREAGLSVVHDAMYGAGQGLLSAVLGEDRVVALHSEINPGFGGTPPEPIERNLSRLMAAVPGHSAGIANDGDADRIGMVDEHGRFVDSHRLLALLLQYLHEVKGLGGSVVKTFSTTDMLDRMASEFGLPIQVEPIGFKYVCERMLEGDVLVGGEESGGIAVKGHLPERDGIYIGLLILEMMAHRGATLSGLVDELHARFGMHAYHRVDAHTSQDRMDRAMATLRENGGLDRVRDDRVRSVETLDGFKHRLQDGWVLVRPSGTEPVLRIYAEAGSVERARDLVEGVVETLGV